MKTSKMTAIVCALIFLSGCSQAKPVRNKKRF